MLDKSRILKYFFWQGEKENEELRLPSFNSKLTFGNVVCTSVLGLSVIYHRYQWLSLAGLDFFPTPGMHPITCQNDSHFQQ